MKKLIPIILTLAMFLTGCMSGGKMSKIAKTELEKKYGENFTVVDTRKINNKCFFAWLSPEGSELVYRAEMNKDGTGLLDNYAVKCLCHRVSEQAETYLTDYKDEHYVYTGNILEYTIGDNPDATAAEHCTNNPMDRFDVDIFVEDGADLSKLYQKIMQMRFSMGFTNGYINVFVIPSGELSKLKEEIIKYDELGSKKVQGIMNSGKKIFISLDPIEKMPSLEEFKRSMN